MVLLRKRFPQKANLQPAAELNVITKIEMSKIIKRIALISLAHYIIYWVFFLMSFSSGMAFALDGIKPSLLEVIAINMNRILELPLMHLILGQEIFKFKGLWGHLPLFINSIVWGLFLYFSYQYAFFLGAKIKARKSKKKCRDDNW